MISVAKEIQPLFIICTLILVGVQFTFGGYVTLLWLPWFAFAFLIRDFHRDIPPIPLAIISPVDGVVQAISHVRNPWLDQVSCCYTLAQSRLGEFNLHSPSEGKLEQLWVRHPQDHKKALSLWIKTDEQDDVVVHVEFNSRWQHGGTALHPGERIGQGQRCGFAALGCKVNVYLPEHVNPVAQVGEKVTAGKNILAQLVHT